MSGAPENNRWARGGPQQQQSRNAANRSGNSTPRDGSSNNNNRQSMSFTGNAWGNNSRNASGSRTPQPAGGAPPAQAQQQQQQQQLPERKKDAAPAVEARHTPVRGFNADELRTLLGKGYKEAIASAPGAYVKVDGDSVPKRSSGVWANKQIDVKNMANGQNFWTQLSLQVQKLEQGK